MSEDVNVENPVDAPTFIDPNSDDVWGACANFTRDIFWHGKTARLAAAKNRGAPG
jgi:hypothetical protein